MDEKKNKEIIILASGKKVNKKTWIMSTLRRASYRWPARNEAEKLGRVDRGLYKCAMCEGSFRSKEYAIDHIKPVISLKDGFTSWDEVIETLFCDIEGFQILCHACHDQKTAIEDTMRANYNAERKAEEKKRLKEEKRIEKAINKLLEPAPVEELEKILGKKILDKVKKKR